MATPPRAMATPARGTASSDRTMAYRSPRVTGAELALLGGLAVWACFPLVLLLVRAAQTHTTFTGADGLIGADGVLGADQLQYLAWVRDASTHGLISDLFTLGPSGHVYFQPVYVISGLLARLGLPVTVAYLLWKPLAVLALLAAAVLWARRLIGPGRAARAATVALTLFLSTPLAVLFSWARLGAPALRFNLFLIGDELLAADKLWGYVPAALGIALVPVALLAVERALEPGGDGRTGGAVAVAALASLGAGLLHPWQGVALIVIYAGLAAWRRLRGALVLGLAAICAGLPLAYYYLLSHADPAWQIATRQGIFPHLPALPLLAGLGPIVLLAGLGLRRPEGVVIEQALLLWIAGCAVAYFGNATFPPHALAGLSFPFAVLIVRGGLRLRVPLALGLVAVGALTVPAVAYYVDRYTVAAARPQVQLYLPPADVAALSSITGGGGVLAPTPFAAVIPARTGRREWVGQGFWTPDYPSRARLSDRLFGGHMRPSAARALVAATGASTLIADCRHPADLRRELGSLITSVRVYGCARVYTLARSARR